MKAPITKEVLEDLYYNRNKSLREIADMLNCSVGTVSYYFKKYNIKGRTLQEAMKISRHKRQPIIYEIELEEASSSKETLNDILNSLEDKIEPVVYDYKIREDITIPIPLKLLRSKGKKDITLTLVLSDLHLGDSDHLPNIYWNTVNRVNIILDSLKQYFTVKRFRLVLNGDIVSGREIYEYQVFRNLLQRGHWQVFLAEIVIKKTIERLNIPVDEIYLIKGTHEPISENYLLYLKKSLKSLGYNTYYLSHSKVLDIGSPIGHYNVLFTHGKGKSAYYPVSYELIRDLWKTVAQYRQSKIIVERVCTSHSHWLTTNLMLEGLTIDVTGGYQRWEYSISQRPCGMIMYLFYDSEVSSIPIRPDAIVEGEEKNDASLEYKNMKYYSKMLLDHMKEVEE